VSVHPVRLRKRLDPQSLVAAERHPVTGRLAPDGRRDKSRARVRASMAVRTGFSGTAGVLAVGALLTLAAGGAAAAVKSGSSGARPHRAPSAIAGQSAAPTSRPAPAPAPASLPRPCTLVSQAVAQTAVGAPVQPSDNKPTSCLYAGAAPSPFRTIEIRYERNFDVAHVQRTLAAAHVAPRPITGLPAGAFSHPAFIQSANGQTQFSPAEAVVPVGPVTVIISTITLDESAGKLVNPTLDEVAAAAVAVAALPPYIKQ